MSLDTILQMTITAQSKSPTQVGFGTPLIAVYHSKYLDRVREYGSQDELLDDGFSTSDAVYKIATAIKSQAPCPPTFKVGRRAIVHATTLDPTGHIATGNVLTAVVDGKSVTHTVLIGENGNQTAVCAAFLAAAIAALPGYTCTTDNTVVQVVGPGGAGVTTSGLADIVATPVTLNPPQQTVNLIPTNLITGFEYTGTIAGKALDYSVAGGDAGSLSAVCTALGAAISALSIAGATVNVTSAHVQIVAPAGSLYDYAFDAKLKGALQIKDVTTDTTLVADLAAIRDVDDDWYCLLLDTNNAAAIAEGASYVEAIRKIFIAQTADWDAKDNAQTGDILTILKTAGYARTAVIFHSNIGGISWAAAGWAAGRLPVAPGAETWAFKSIAGVPFCTLRPGEESAILAKNATHYTNTGGLAITFEGKSSSGEFIDTVRGIDWLYATMRTALLGVLANNKKIPYTNKGVKLLRAAMLAVLDQAVKATLLSDDVGEEPTVTAPRVQDVDATTRKNRILPDVKFAGQLAGAIHRLVIDGTISI